MPPPKMSAEEMVNYYLRVHQEVLKRDESDCLAAVIAPDANRLANRFTDFAHRLGMKEAFTQFRREWGSLTGRTVLDVGCGRGRWSKEYATRGAKVTGVDISPEAVRLLSQEMPQHQFLAEDITKLSFPDESFDVVNSVTVLQHMPPFKQEVALALVSRWVRRGGYVVLLENILGFNAPHVFPHRTDEWIKMVETAGFNCTCSRGSNYELLFRIKGRALRLLRGRSPRAKVAPSPSGSRRSSFKVRVKSGVTGILAAMSFPLEYVCNWVPLCSPTHRVMIFRKPA